MPRAYAELDVQPTPLGELILRRRRPPAADADVWEVLLDGRFLMSSRVHVSETALATRALAQLDDRAPHVLVGGLGLGYTAHAALTAPRVASVTVIELLPAVIAWHARGLLPLGDVLARDPRCALLPGDFFAQVAHGTLGPGRRPPAGWDAVLIDIDHSPTALLAEGHRAFYDAPGLRRLAGQLAPGGVLGYWSADLPDPGFTARLAAVFDDVRADVVEFYNPHIDRHDANTVYTARKRA